MKQLMLILILLAPIKGQAQNHQYKIQQIKNGYTFSYTFETSLEKDSTLSILFSYNHLIKYSSQATNIKLISEDKNSYIVSFTLKYLIFSSESVYRRSIVPEKDLVLIEMLHFSHNSSLIPVILKSTVEYRVLSEGKKTKVTYLQKCLFEKKINWIYLKIIEGKLIESADELRKYLEHLSPKK